MPKILIVEDNKTLIKMMKIKLTRAGYTVATAADGEMAIAAIKEKPDAVLLDMRLPKKSGLEVLEAIQKFPKLLAIPVIIISNSGQPIEIQRAKQLGVKDFLIKTDFTPQDVIEKVAAFVPLRSKTGLPAPKR